MNVFSYIDRFCLVEHICQLLPPWAYYLLRKTLENSCEITLSYSTLKNTYINTKSITNLVLRNTSGMRWWNKLLIRWNNKLQIFFCVFPNCPHLKILEKKKITQWVINPGRYWLGSIIVNFVYKFFLNRRSINELMNEKKV